MTDDRITRRRLLAVAGTAVATGLAGCGYQPGGGELEWETRVGGGLPFGSSTRIWLEGPDALVSVRNRSGRTFDFEVDEWVEVKNAGVTVYDSGGDVVWSGTTERQYAGVPAVADGTVFVPLEDGTVTALAADSTADGGARSADGPIRDDGGRTLWTTDRTGPPLELAAGDGVVASASRDGIRGFDIADGTELFALERSLGEATNADPGRRRVSPATRLAVADGRVWAASSGSDPHLYGVDADGTGVTELSLPARADWVAAAGETCLVRTGSDLWGVGPDGDRRFELSVGRSSTAPALVGDRCYLRDGREIVAVDAADGERTWTYEGPALSSGLVADADGVYARTGSRRRESCDLLAVGPDGDERWRAATPDEPGCSGDLCCVGDRIVVLTDDHLYGFRTAPGPRHTLL